MSDRSIGRRGALGLAAAASVLGLRRARAAGTHWDCYIYNPVATVAASRGMADIIEAVGRATGDALAISLHLGGSLPINTTTITQAVSDGVVQMGDDGYFLGNVPIAGVPTIEAMHAAGATCLCVEAGRTLLFDREGMVGLADQYGIAIAGVSAPKTSV